MDSQHKADWTFLSNHAHVLIYISKFQESRIRDVADAVGITERFAQKILKDLEDAGYLTSSRQGRRKSYEVVQGLKFRHPLEDGAEISQLLTIFSDK
jgi:DNA-binding MarR family transcriptional regulator